MKTPSHAGSALVAAALMLGSSQGFAQQVAVESPEAQRLRVTTTSEEAGRHFWTGLFDTRNWFLSRAATHFDQALALDSSLGLARIVRAVFAPNLTTDQRNAEVQRGIATMPSASTGEMVTALAFRETLAGNTREGQRLFETASRMLPGDPSLAFYAALMIQEPGQQVEAFRGVIERFPDEAAAYNILAYTLWRIGDHDEAITAVRKYMEIAPDHPNPHDSYAELLQWDGRFNEALAHYGRAVEIDSAFVEAHMGSAEVLQLTGRGDAARTHIRQAIARAPDAETRVNFTRALAHSFLLDGKLREAMDQFAAAAREAQANDRKPLAAQTHREMALADALLGRGSEITQHLATAAQIDTTNETQQLVATAVAHGTAGDITAARQAAAKVATVAQSDSQYATTARAANAVVLLRENKANEALIQLSGANASDALVRALFAEAYRATGNTADARGLRNQVINNPQINLANGWEMFARIRASRIKP